MLIVIVETVQHVTNECGVNNCISSQLQNSFYGLDDHPTTSPGKDRPICEMNGPDCLVSCSVPSTHTELYGSIQGISSQDELSILRLVN